MTPCNQNFGFSQTRRIWSYWITAMTKGNDKLTWLSQWSWVYQSWPNPWFSCHVLNHCSSTVWRFFVIYRQCWWLWCLRCMITSRRSGALCCWASTRQHSGTSFNMIFISDTCFIGDLSLLGLLSNVIFLKSWLCQIFFCRNLGSGKWINVRKNSKLIPIS